MRLITRNDIQNWAGRHDAKGQFPALICFLIRATTPVGTFVEFPSGSATFVGGWDGRTESNEDTPYVPKGIALWEFGTGTGNNTKAEDDYIKRTADPLGYDTSKCIFIFATPTFWRDKDTWRTEKLKEGKWLDIRTYDSRNLEEWIAIAPAVSKKFAAYIGKHTDDGMLFTETFWEDWSVGPPQVGVLPPESVTTGRAYESEEIRQFLSKSAGIKGVRANSKNEAIAFIIASAMQFSGE